jgi:hypothetical protein
VCANPALLSAADLALKSSVHAAFVFITFGG